MAELYPIVGQLSAALEQIPTDHRETWEELDVLRTTTYERNRGIFLVHTWTPSNQSGQVADVVVKLAQHRDGPLSQGKIKSVQYTLGGKFDTHTVVQTKPSEDFRIEVSMYGPMLCVAKVAFVDESPPRSLAATSIWIYQTLLAKRKASSLSLRIPRCRSSRALCIPRTHLSGPSSGSFLNTGDERKSIRQHAAPR